MTDEKGEVFFVGKDVATTLGYSDSRKAIRVHVDEEDKGVGGMATPGGKQRVILINESGLYSLILSSKLPQAKAFKHWVTSEVLPQIRKTGGYIPTRDEKGKELSPEEVLARAHQIVGRTLRLLNGPNCDCLTATQVAESWGRDTFYAEAYEDLARQLDGDKHETGDAYVMNVEMNARTWPTKDGEQRTDTRLTLRSLNWFFSPRAELDPNR